MCGIAGFATGAKKENLKKVYNIYKDILVFSVRRGHDATGIAATMPSGKITVTKHPTPSPLFVNDAAFKLTMGRKPVAVIGHVRAATKGSPYNNKNNHPILAGNIVGVHNGVIRNDEYLTRHFELKRNALVDSEVIFALLNKLGPLDKAGIQRVMTLLDGHYALAFQHAGEPGRIWLVRGPGRPLVVGYDTRLHTAWFASEADFIARAYRKNGVSQRGLEIGEMEQGDVMTIDGTHLLADGREKRIEAAC